MSDVKISELPDAGEITGDELLPLVQDNETKKATVAEIGASLIAWEVKSTNFNAESNHSYSTYNAITATLPASPANGDCIKFRDARLTWHTANTICARNGNNINNVASNYTLNVQGGAVCFVFETGYGWSVSS